MQTIKVNQNEIFLDQADSLVLTILNGGSAVTITSASYSLYNSGGTALVESTAITPSGNTLTVSISSSTFDEVEEDCRVVWEFLIDGVTYQEHTLFDVVKFKLINAVSDSDLQKWYPNIQDDLWTGQTTYDDQIQKAFDQVRNDIKSKGRRPDLVLMNSQIQTLIELKALEIIFQAFAKTPDDLWSVRSEKSQTKYEEWLNKVQFKYDASGDGVPDEKVSFSRVRINR